MGLFSDKVKVYAQSQTYNLAGDRNGRPKYLSSTILSGILGGTGKESLGRHISLAFVHGPASNRKRYFKWCKDNFPAILPQARIDNIQKIQASQIIPALTALHSLASNQSPRVWNCVIDDADVTYWGEAWMRENRASELNEDYWYVDGDPLTSTIILTIGGPNPQTVNIPYPAELTWAIANRKKLLYCFYTIRTESVTGVITSTKPLLWVYRVGSGTYPALDALYNQGAILPEFFPVMTIRHDEDRIVKNASNEKQWDAYKKLTGQSFDDFLDDLHETDNITDVEFAFLVHGVSLNTQDQSGLAYLYAFFKMMADNQQYTLEDYNDYEAGELVYYQSSVTQDRIEKGVFYVGGSPETYRVPVKNKLKLEVANDGDYEIELTWNYARESVHLGNAGYDPVAPYLNKLKLGEYAITRDEVSLWDLWVPERDDPDGDTVRLPSRADIIYIYHQYEKYRYSRIEVHQLSHRNNVYKNKGITIDAHSALADDEDSGLIIPLHYPTLMSLSAKHRNQLATFDTLVLLNSYKEVKISWYQRGIFRIIASIAVFAIASLTAGAALAAAPGVLGSNAAVGAALGATTVASAALAGAIANALAATIVSTVISAASKSLFGDKWGSVIGVIITMVAMTYATAWSTTGSFQVNWGEMMRADKLIKMTETGAKLYSSWLEGNNAEIQQNITDLAKKAEDASKTVQEKTDEILQMTGVAIDPIILTDVTLSPAETSEAFTARTLLTGDEIAELTQLMVEEFADYTLDLPILTA